MGQNIRKLISEIKKVPWVMFSRKGCHTREFSEAFVSLIDDTLFEQDAERGLELAFLFRILTAVTAESHARCKAEACVGSAYRALNLYERANKQMELAERSAGDCDDCLGEVYWRWGAVFCYEGNLKQALALFDRSVLHFERVGLSEKICKALLGRSAVCRYSELNSQGFDDVIHGVGLLHHGMPSRLFVAAAVNSLSLAVALDEEEKISTALEIVDAVRTKVQGCRAHSRALPVLRWVRGLAFEKIGNSKESVRLLESAIKALDRLGMIGEKKAAMADLARIRRKGKQLETNDRHILRLIEECLRLERDLERLEILERARRDPSDENLLAWRSSQPSYVPILEPVGDSRAIV